MASVDLPDWTQGSTAVASTVQLKSGTIASGTTLDEIDVSRWQSLQVTLIPNDIVIGPSIGFLRVYEYAGAFALPPRTFTFNSASSTAHASYGLNAVIPLRGTKVALEYVDENGVNPQIYIINGLSRALPLEVNPWSRPLNGPLDLLAHAVSVGAGDTLTVGYAGPFTEGVVLALACDPSVVALVYAGNWNTAGFTYSGAGTGTSASSQYYTNTMLRQAGMLLELRLRNTDSTAHTTTVTANGI